MPETLYDFANRWPPLHWMLLATIPLVAGALQVRATSHATPVRGAAPGSKDDPAKKRRDAWGLLIFGAVIALGVTFALGREFFLARRVYKAQTYVVAEGPVEKMTRVRKKLLTVQFEVGGVRFWCAEGSLNQYGYCPLEGPVENGRHVRIAYWPTEKTNVILKLDLLR